MDKDWKVQTKICWGERDRWLSYDGVEDFCKGSNHKLLKLPMVPTVLTYSHLFRNIKFLDVACRKKKKKKTSERKHCLPVIHWILILLRKWACCYLSFTAIVTKSFTCQCTIEHDRRQLCFFVFHKKSE